MVKSPSIAEARKEYNLHSKHRIVSSFEALLSKYQDHQNSFNTIAEQENCSRQNIQQFYNRRFKSLCQGNDGLERRRLRHKENKNLVAQHFIQGSLLTEIYDRATKAGIFNVHRVWLPDSQDFSKTLISINNKICRVEKLTGTWGIKPDSASSNTKLVRKAKVLETYDFDIIWQKVANLDDLFIFPAKVLKSEISGDAPKIFYLPLYRKNDGSSHRKTKIDFLSYLNAWELLKTEPS